MLDQVYKSSLALLTDLYEITMAYAYWKTGTADKEACFHVYFRKNPFDGGYAVSAGLGTVIEYLNRFTFDESDLVYLSQLTGADQKPLFESAFIDSLRGLRLRCDVDAVPEGTPVFAYEPLVRVTGPLLHCQLIESAVLNQINFQTLIATKAARICEAAQGDEVIEFGLRRAQGFDGGISATRAAYIGGCHGTSNVLAGKLFGIPVRGTHAHSWVMSFDSERIAFEKFAEAVPNNAVLLIDTYETLHGAREAARVGKILQEQGHRLLGVRLDSGDLAYLSQQVRKILDEAGLADAKILATNDLDEHVIASLKQQRAAISVWGVGTRLITAYDQPALAGVYKLAAIRKSDGTWEPKVKVSEQASKTTIPGRLQVKRFVDAGRFVGDSIFDLDRGMTAREAIDPSDPMHRKRFPEELTSHDLLVPIMRAGKMVYAPPSMKEIRQQSQGELGKLHPSIRRFLNPHTYPVGLDPYTHHLRTTLTLKARES